MPHRNPERPDVELPMREVWAVPYNLALRASVDEIQEVGIPIAL